MAVTRIILGIGLATLVMALPAAAVADSGLRGIMHSWRGEARVLQRMLSGRTTLDEGEIRSALALYAEDARGVEARINGRSPAALDFRRRFGTFRADAETAVDDLSRSGAWRTDVPRLLAECHSCHEVYKQ